MTKFEINSSGHYEIDFYNYGSESEKNFLSNLSKRNDCVACFYKSGSDWIKIVSGMTFRLNGMSYYQKLKEYLDHKLNLYLRKSKLQKISEFIPDQV